MPGVFWFICAVEANASAPPVVAGSQPNFNRAVVNNLTNLRKTRHGIGDLLARPNSKAITNHVLCDGSAISRVGFPQLFAEIGTEWGAGDGSTTFNLPNLNEGTLPVPATVPTQTVSPGGTVSTGGAVTNPNEPGQTGGTSGGNVVSGGVPPKPRKIYNPNGPEEEEIL